MFKRKVYNKLLAWKRQSDGHSALLIEGARRIGKSTIAEGSYRVASKCAQVGWIQNDQVIVTTIF